MPTRERIVDAADRLFYERGFESTSFAHIAAAVQLSRGNFYYHFKSKDEILDAVIEARVANARAMLDEWSARADDPAGQIGGFVEMWLANQAEIVAHGCPVGSLCIELTKLGHASQPEAAALFTLFHDWLCARFVELGRERDAELLATDLMVRSQGVAALASAFRDESLIRREVVRMNAWVEACAKDAT